MGRREGKRCDARCHEAREAACSCWCGGRYHGVGRLEARRRMIAELGAGVVNRYGSRRALDHGPLFSHDIIAATRGRHALAAAAAFARKVGLL